MRFWTQDFRDPGPTSLLDIPNTEAASVVAGGKANAFKAKIDAWLAPWKGPMRVALVAGLAMLGGVALMLANAEKRR
jgi:hypothetical protein